MLRTISISVLAALSAATFSVTTAHAAPLQDGVVGLNSNAKFTPAEVHTRMKFGYGKYVAVMKPSMVKGAVASFFLFNYLGQDTAWPANWREVDFEFNPGMTPDLSPGLKWNYFVDGSCTDPASCAPQKLNGSQDVNKLVSFNTFSYSAEGQTTASDQQVSYLAGFDPSQAYHTYTIYYTPAGIWWEIDGKVVFQKHEQDAPTTDPTTFVHGADMKAFNESPDMNIYFNLWDAAGPYSTYFGGKTEPKPADSSIHSVAFYPMTDTDCTSGPSCSYDSQAEMSSDFQQGKFAINGVPVTFSDIWLRTDNFVDSLGGTFNSHNDQWVPGTDERNGLTLSLTDATSQSRQIDLTNGIDQPMYVAYTTTMSIASGTPFVTTQYNKPGTTIPVGGDGQILLPADAQDLLITYPSGDNVYGYCRVYNVNQKIMGSGAVKPGVPLHMTVKPPQTWQDDGQGACQVSFS